MTAFLFLVPFIAGCGLDVAIGDPPGLPHLTRAYGALIARLERPFRGKATTPHLLLLKGALFTVAVVALGAGVPALLLCGAYWLHPAVGVALETILVYESLAIKDLRTESMRVKHALDAGNDLNEARLALSMIVGRDVDRLDRNGIIRATVETVAENSSDGAAAPLFFIAIAGGAGGCFYKVANTLDSSVGYKNDKYLYFGRASARLDDALNYIPSRLDALLFIVAAALLRYDASEAWRIWRRDKRNHNSPNAAQTESACAGALNLRLGGPAYYEGILEYKMSLGDNNRPITTEDIANANKLHYTASTLMFILCVGVRLCCMAAIFTTM
jgi:adenosylcobinamide-phosphate synthase